MTTHNLLKFEVMQEDTLYAITINPNDDHQYWSSIDRVNDFLVKTKKLLASCTNDTCYLELFPEISPNGRLHYHGYIKLFNKIGFYVNCIHKMIHWSHVDIDTLSPDTNWETYILKQTELHNHLMIKEIPIPIKIGIDFRKMNKHFFSNGPITD